MASSGDDARSIRHTLARAVAMTQTPAALIGRDGRHLASSEAYRQLTGRDEGWLVAHRLGEVEQSPDLPVDVDAELGRLLRRAVRVRDRDGRQRWVQMLLLPIPEPPGTEMTLILLDDISRAVTAEAEAASLRGRLTLLADGAQDLVLARYQLRPVLECEFISADAERLTGYSPHGHYERPDLLFELVHRADRPAVDRLLTDPVDAPSPVVFRLDTGGDEKWVQARHVPVFGFDGSVNGVELLLTDVTRVRASEEETHRKRELFVALVRNAFDVLVVVDRDGVIRFANPAVSRVFECGEDLAVGRPLLSFVDREHVERAQLALDAWWRGASTAPVQLPIWQRHGEPRWLEATGINLLDDPAVEGIVINGRDCTERRRYEQQLIDAALRDGLTGLPNRVAIRTTLAHALARLERTDAIVAVLFVDLDRFKVINDSLGHDAGDDVLRTVARRLEASLRPGDTAARLGGDEFVVCCEDVHSERQVLEIAYRLMDEIRRPIRVGPDHEVSTRASIGIAMCDRNHIDAERLIGDADLAMYRSKQSGGDRVEFFVSTLRHRAVVRLDIEQDLRRALASDDLHVAYQPIVSLHGDRLIGAEALVRWSHAERGEILPHDFIPLAEETGLIEALSRRVFDSVCRQLAAWRITHPQRPDLTIGVNVSGRQFLDGYDAFGYIEETIDRYDISPSDLILEITESVLIERGDAVKVLRRLHDMGLRLALDDFGMRYSSLAYLRQLRFDVLKVDRSFVSGITRDRQDHAIVQGVIHLSHDLGMDVVAEGVETVEQLDELRRMGADHVQGFLVARPDRPEMLAGMFPAG
jgi:diguanylate cyclase (GGDEF)-like protein/PAS domain S-box-containing protein